jgi:drug/metabolite transporter (DMT)-like permease
MAFAAAAAIGPVSTASVLVAQTGTISALVGMWVLKERPAKAQVVGIVLAIVAVTLLAMSEAG